MASRKQPSLSTKLASALLALGDIPYDDAKAMTAAQIISLYQFDHGILHETGHPDRDRYWNLTPMLIQRHREKTLNDLRIISKGRRLRAKLPNAKMITALDELDAAADAPALRTGPGESQRHAGHGAHVAAAPRPARSRSTRKIISRPFDRRFKRKLSGKVVPR
jgi:hypothetical protein